MTRPSEPFESYLEQAVRHLRLALVCLDAAGEMRAAPYAQMAIDILGGWVEDAAIESGGE